MADAGEYGLDKSHLNITETYRDFQLGRITEKITIVDSSISLSDALKPGAFVKNLQEEFDAFTKDAIQVDDFTAIMIEVE
jgi:hypothetical protein